MTAIITIGEILVEIMAKEVGQKFNQVGEYIGPFPSGAPAIFIDQAARCGSDSMIISAVGNDDFGRVNLGRLEESGVNLSKVHVLKDETTGTAFVTYKEDGTRDFIFHIVNAACGKVDETLIEEKDFKDSKYFHIMGSSIYNEGVYQAILKGMDLTKKNGSKISFDPNVRKEILNDQKKRESLVEILNKSNIVLAGEDELYYLTGIEDEEKSVNRLLQKEAELVVIKRGSKGASLYTKDDLLHCEAYQVEEVDPTGAGDCFGGTFLSCLNQGIEPKEAIHLAIIAGAKAVTKRGPMEGNTTLSELIQLQQESNRGVF